MAMEAREDGTLGPGPRIMEAGVLNPENLEAAGVTSIKIHVQGSCVQGLRARSREESQSGNQRPRPRPRRKDQIDPGSEETTMTTGPIGDVAEEVMSGVAAM